MDAEHLRQAAHWHARLADAPAGPSRDAALAGFHAWAGMREEHRQAFVAVTKAGALAHDLADRPPLVEMAAATHARIVGRKRQRRLGLAALCGAVVMTPVAALTIRSLVGSTDPKSTAPAVRSFETKVGERKVITLAPSTRVFLDTASRLTVDGSVLRIRGQAYVAGGGDPLTIALPDLSLRLHGGGLNVRQEGARTAVLAEGRSTLADVAGLPGPLTIGAGQVLTLSGGQRRIADAADPAALTSWRGGWLLFDDVPLSSAAAEINRYRRTPIRLAPAVKDFRISGSFRIDDNADFLAAVAATLPTTVRRTSDGPTIVPAASTSK